jgi:hypothetical protein
MRNGIAIVAGLFAAFGVTAAIELISTAAFPPDSPLDWNDRSAIRKHIESLPPIAIIIVLIAHLVGAFAASLVCTLISSTVRFLPTILYGSLLTIFGIINLVMIPHPIWFTFIDPVTYVSGALFGEWLARSIKGEQLFGTARAAKVHGESQH